MTRLNRALVALSVCAAFAVASPAVAQGTKTQEPLKPVLSGKFVPPVSGTADVQYTQPKTVRKGKQVVTTLQVKNMSAAPIAGLKLDEVWYDGSGALVPGGDRYVHKKVLQPGEIITITLTDEYDTRMKSNMFQFSHARGQVKGKKVVKF